MIHIIKPGTPLRVWCGADTQQGPPVFAISAASGLDPGHRLCPKCAAITAQKGASTEAPTQHTGSNHNDD